MPVKMPTLSLCMIVKDEEKNLKQCLESVQGLADEIIIVDTGSSDKTKEIAAKFTGKIYDFQWCDDFSAARNFSLKQAAGEWILVLDADEIITEEDHQAIKAAISKEGIAAYFVVTRNYSNDSSLSGWQPCGDKFARQFQGWHPSVKIRLFRNRCRDCQVQFVGKMHEMVEEEALSKIGRIEMLSIPIHHYGFGGLNDKNLAKTQKYVELTQQKIAAEPQNAKAYFELGVQYKELGRLELAEEAFRHSLQLDNSHITPLLNLALVQQKQRKLEEAKGNFLAVLEKAVSGNNAGRADACLGLGCCFFREGNLAQAEEYFTRAVKCNPNFLDAYVNLGAVLEQKGDFKAATGCYRKALQLNPKHARTYYNLGVLHEKCKNLPLALKCYEKALELAYSKPDLPEKIGKIKQFLGKLS